MTQPPKLNHLVFSGAPTAIPDFSSSRPYTYCRICGAVFQDNSLPLRQAWSFNHSNKHSEKEHQLLQASGNWLTREAAEVLVKYGVISLTDLVLSKEHEKAYANSSPT